MVSRIKTAPRYRDRESQDSQIARFSIPLPRLRLWKVLLVLALPFIVVSWNYLETLERTGPAGALVADIAMPVVIIGYAALLGVLKKRKL